MINSPEEVLLSNQNKVLEKCYGIIEKPPEKKKTLTELFKELEEVKLEVKRIKDLISTGQFRTKPRYEVHYRSSFENGLGESEHWYVVWDNRIKEDVGGLRYSEIKHAEHLCNQLNQEVGR